MFSMLSTDPSMTRLRWSVSTSGHGNAVAVCLKGRGIEVVVGSKVGDLTLEPIEDSGFGIAEAARPIHDGVEYRLLVRWRSADHAEDFARRRLLLEGFREVAVARPQLAEEPHVLDGDHSLGCKGLHES